MIKRENEKPAPGFMCHGVYNVRHFGLNSQKQNNMTYVVIKFKDII